MFFSENKACHFVRIVCQADDSHKKFNVVLLSLKKDKEKIKSRLLQFCLALLRVNIYTLSKVYCDSFIKKRIHTVSFCSD